jgi:hypothetical protein
MRLVCTSRRGGGDVRCNGRGARRRARRESESADGDGWVVVPRVVHSQVGGGRIGGGVEFIGVPCKLIISENMGDNRGRRTAERRLRGARIESLGKCMYILGPRC